MLCCCSTCLCDQEEALIAIAVMKTALLISSLLEHSNAIGERELRERERERGGEREREREREGEREREREGGREREEGEGEREREEREISEWVIE